MWHAVTHPGETWDALKKPFVDAWESGHPWQAIGRGVVAVGSLLVGTHGADKVADLARVGRAAEIGEVAVDAERVAEAGTAATRVAEAETAAARASEAEAATTQRMASQTPGAASGGVRSTRGVLPDFNPTAGSTNCARCAEAVDRYLAGEGWSQALPAQTEWPVVNGVVRDASAWTSSSARGVESALQFGGDGSRGLVLVEDTGAGTAHVFNAANQGGQIVAIDGQVGVMGSIQDVATAAGYSGPNARWYWVPTK
jgi:hypothetical protein